MGAALEPKGSIAVQSPLRRVRAIRCSAHALDICDLRVKAGVGVKA